MRCCLSLVTDALVRTLPKWTRLPSKTEADQQKVKLFEKAGFPNVIACIDGTHVHIQVPTSSEHEYVNRKNQHSVNVQVLFLLHFHIKYYIYAPAFIKQCYFSFRINFSFSFSFTFEATIAANIMYLILFITYC